MCTRNVCSYVNTYVRTYMCIPIYVRMYVCTYVIFLHFESNSPHLPLAIVQLDLWRDLELVKILDAYVRM